MIHKKIKGEKKKKLNDEMETLQERKQTLIAKA